MKDSLLVSNTRFRVEGMDCAACATKIENALGRMPGIRNVSVSVPAGTVTVAHDDSTPQESMRRGILGLGYVVTASAEVGAKAGKQPLPYEHSGHSHIHEHQLRATWTPMVAAFSIAERFTRRTVVSTMASAARRWVEPDSMPKTSPGRWKEPIWRRPSESSL